VLTGQDKHESLFNLTLDIFEALGTSAEKAENLFCSFRLKVLEEMGYAIDTAVPEGGGERLVFLPSEGKVVWRGKGGVAGYPLDVGTWKLLSLLNTSEFEKVRRIRINREGMRQIWKALDLAFEAAFERWRPLESLQLLQPGGTRAHPSESAHER
jgi:hypothetical protein